MADLQSLQIDFEKVYNEGNSKYFLFNSKTKEGQIIISTNNELCLKNTNFDIINLEEISADFIRDNNLIYKLIPGSLEKNNETGYIKGYNTKLNKISDYDVLYNINLTWSSEVIYVAKNKNTNELHSFIITDSNTEDYFIKDTDYEALEKIFSLTNNSEEIGKKIKTYYKKNDETPFIHYLFWIKELISEKGLEKDKEDIILEILKTIFYDKNNFIDLSQLIYKTMNISWQGIIPDQTFINLFNQSSSRMKFALKFAKVKAVEDLNLFENGDHFDLDEFNLFEIKYILEEEYFFKEEIYKDLIQSGVMIKYIENEGKDYDVLSPTFIYFKHLIYFLYKDFENDKTICYLEELNRFMRFYDFKFGTVKDKTKPYMYDLKYINKINIKKPQERVFYDRNRYEIKPYKANLKEIKGLEYLNKEELEIFKTLEALNIIDLKNEKEVATGIDKIIKMSIKYKSIEDLTIMYIKEDNKIKNKIRLIKDFKKIEKDIEFFNLNQ